MQPPSADYWFGTDKLGRDVFTRTLMGGREAMLISTLACAFAMAWGGILGTFVALVGGEIRRMEYAGGGCVPVPAMDPHRHDLHHPRWATTRRFWS